MLLVAAEAMARVARAASDPLAPADRASAVLAELRTLVPFDHAELAFDDPFDGHRHLLANDGYALTTLDHLHGPAFDEEIQALDMHLTGTPVRMADVPGDSLAVRTIAEVLRPAGYVEGMTMVLLTADGRRTGLLNMSMTESGHPTDSERAVVQALNQTLANVADVTQSVRFLASLIEPGLTAVALGCDGSTIELAGIPSHALLADAALLAAARAVADANGSRVRFLWPAGRRDWHRVTVTRVRDGLSGCNAVVALSPDTVETDLTRRELEVLTMLTSGWSNAEIASRLVLSPRTVGSYVEQVLAKLSVPTRAAAAAHAVAEGFVVPLRAPDAA